MFSQPLEAQPRLSLDALMGTIEVLKRELEQKDNALKEREMMIHFLKHENTKLKSLTNTKRDSYELESTN